VWFRIILLPLLNLLQEVFEASKLFLINSNASLDNFYTVGLTKNQRDCIMQEFLLPHGQEVCGMFRSWGKNQVSTNYQSLSCKKKKRGG
jgi:hypothetical protein